MTLELVPVSFATACEVVAELHRHHVSPEGHKFSVGVADESGVLRGVVIVGRPVSRVLQAEGDTLEVYRSATDGTPNANSMLYGAAKRATFAMGYRRLITYTQAGESGASLRAAGYRIVAERPPRNGWNAPSRPRDGHGTDGVARTLWASEIFTTDADERTALAGVSSDG